MRLPHVLCEGASGVTPGEPVALSPAAARHLRSVLRLRDGAPLSVTDGRGSLCKGVLGRDGIRITSEWVGSPRPSDLVLHPGVSKGRKLDLVVEKATELGVAEITPVITARTERHRESATSGAKVDRWRAIARSALEQSRGAWLPSIGVPVSISDALSAGRGVLLDPSGASVDWGARRAARLAVGPEGGFSDEELEEAEGAGWDIRSLGSTVLRTETAAIVGAALAILA